VGLSGGSGRSLSPMSTTLVRFVLLGAAWTLEATIGSAFCPGATMVMAREARAFAGTTTVAELDSGSVAGVAGDGAPLGRVGAPFPTPRVSSSAGGATILIARLSRFFGLLAAGENTLEVAENPPPGFIKCCPPCICWCM
jgi:hypothetical protein